MNKPIESDFEQIPAHGGTLVDQLVPERDRESAEDRARLLLPIPISLRTYTWIEIIAIGGYSPLRGFMTETDYATVLGDMRLTGGAVWPIPIVLPVDDKTKSHLKLGQAAALTYEGRTVATIQVESIFSPDKTEEARQIYKTTERNHPGVAELFAQGNTYVGGPIEVLQLPDHASFSQYNLTPTETRRAFRNKGWKTVVGFQTRNPMHRGHEYITKTALETVDGLFVQPAVGALKAGDIPASVRMKCYEALLANYYPSDRVMLSISPSSMFYAGPREAVLHAIVRQNYGCTHFIVGRDHAGVGSYYDPYEAHDLVKSFTRDELEVQPLCFENAFWDKRTGDMATIKTSASDPAERVSLSGTQIRTLLGNGKIPPPHYMRPEVARVLVEALK